MKKLTLIILATITIIIGLCSCNKCIHSWSLPTCEAPKTCTKCGLTEGDARTHSFSEATCANSKTCIYCGKTEGKAKGHSWSSKLCNEIKVCKNCNEVGEPTEHIWQSTECKTISNCTVCGKMSDVFDHNWQNATCNAPKTCLDCGITEGMVLSHNYIQITCSEPRVCTLCKETTKEGIVHNWIFISCTEARKCDDCGLLEATIYGHEYLKATCYEPKTCVHCGATEGQPFEHAWIGASCKAPQTCARCGITEGEKLIHDWELVLKTEALCEDGKEKYCCKGCGEEYEYTYASALDYHICNEDNVCEGCNRKFDNLILDSILLENTYSVERCGIFTTSETEKIVYKTITIDDIGMPIIDLGGSLNGITKENTKLLEFSYNSADIDFDCYVEIKLQGASSLNYPKKNYSIKLVDSDGSKNKVELDQSWGKEHKYCMKANYVDFSQARNVVSAKIFGEIAKNANDERYDLPNGGAIDGFPVLVYNDGVYHGLYTMNIPKDKWMFDMHDSDAKDQAILMTNNWTKSAAFRELAGSGWEIEFASNEESMIDNSTKWVYESLNKLIAFVMENEYKDGDDFEAKQRAFIEGIEQYADVDKCIDTMLYTFFICADDNISKNTLWITLDGQVWFCSMYDMDGTWGMRWNGYIEFDENTHPISALKDGIGIAPERNPSQYNLLWEELYLYMFDRVAQRYKELRSTALSYDNIEMHFKSFFAIIPESVREAEKQKWTGVPSQSIDHLEQILTFAQSRIEVMDNILILQN